MRFRVRNCYQPCEWSSRLFSLAGWPGWRDAAHHRLHQAVTVLHVFRVIESELGTIGRLSDAQGKPPAHIIVGKRGFVLHPDGAPGVHADRCEIAWLAF